MLNREMLRTRCRFYLLACCLLIVMMSFHRLLPKAAASPVTLPAADLGTLGGDYSYATDINNRGQVVGVSETNTPGEMHAFLWQHGEMIDLGALGGMMSRALAINNHGQIMVQGYRTDGSWFAAVWERGTMIDLGVISGPPSWTFPFDLSEPGYVVGVSSTIDPGENHAFLWHAKDGMIDLGTLGGTHSSASAVNSRGWVVGSSETAEPYQNHAFLWHMNTGRMTDLGTLGGNMSMAQDINEAGQIVGSSETAAGNNHAVMWDKGEILDLGTAGGSTSEARQINDHSQVLGYSATIDGGTAFLWEQGTMIPLGDVMAMDLNNRGQVVGSRVTPEWYSLGFLWQDGLMIDLAALGGQNSMAEAINEQGKIAGACELPSGVQHACLWASSGW